MTKTYKVEFEVECTTATKKNVREAVKDMHLDIALLDDVAVYPLKLKITEINC